MRIPALVLSMCVFALPLRAAEPGRYDEFIAKVRACCEAGDVAALKKLYWFDGTPEVIIDQEIYSWENVMAALKSGKAEYAGAEAHDLETFLKRPGPAADPEMYASIYDPVVMNGTTYAPNLEVVGLVAVRLEWGRAPREA